MKILALSNCRLDRVLGSGRTRLAWAEGLTRLGHEVVTIDSEELLGRSEHRPHGRRPRLAWAAHRRLAAMDLSRFDLIEFFGAEFWLAIWRLARRPPAERPLLVAHTDGLELLMAERLAATRDPAARLPWWKALPSALFTRAEQLAFSRPDGFVCGCDLDRRCLLRLGLGRADRMEVVPIALEPEYLDLPLRLGPGEREPRVAFVGSWIARKGVSHLVTVMTRLLRARPGLALDLFGQDPNEASPHGLFPPEVRGRVTVYPRLSMDTMITALSRAQVYLFPSEYEGFGLGLAEAMACGCAAVTTPTGFGAGLRDGEEALVCPFGDEPCLEAAVARLLDDGTLRERIAAAGWKTVQSLRWEASVRKLEAIYLRWLDPSRPAPLGLPFDHRPSAPLPTVAP